MLTRLYRLLSSWQLSIVLTLSGALYALLLAIWGAKSSPETVKAIARMSPMVLFYLGLLTNLFFCLLLKLPLYFRKMKLQGFYLPDHCDWEDVREVPIILRKKGVPWKGGTLYVFGRWRPLGTLLLHGALFFLALGFFLSHLSHWEGDFWIGYGETLSLDQPIWERATPPRPFSHTAFTGTLHLEDVKVKFWGNELLFTEFVALGTWRTKPFSLAINDPKFINPTTVLRLTSFGYAPVVWMMMEGVDRPVEQLALKLNLFPPGKRDVFRFQHFPHKIYLRLYPDYVDRKGQPDTRSMKLKNPRFLVEVYRGKVFLKKALLSLGQTLQVEQFSFGFVEVVPMVQMGIIHDLGYPWILLGLVMGVGGLGLLPLRRGELWVKEQDGRYIVKGKGIPTGKIL